MNQNRTRVNVSRGSFMRRIVITGPPPVDMLDLVGPLEVFKFAPEYEVAVASPEGTTELQLNHGFKISYAVFCLKMTMHIALKAITAFFEVAATISTYAELQRFTRVVW